MLEIYLHEKDEKLTTWNVILNDRLWKVKTYRTTDSPKQVTNLAHWEVKKRVPDLFSEFKMHKNLFATMLASLSISPKAQIARQAI